MILADASVVIPYIRRADPKLTRLVPALPVAVCGITEAEVLAGSRSPADLARFTAILAGFRTVAVPPDVWPEVGRNLSALLRAGLSIPFTDVTVATVAVVSGLECWARDQHFALMRPHLPGLRLFAEPP